MEKNIYQKLMDARIKLQNTKLNKSGLNKFAGYTYFELGDFLPTITKIFAEVGICSTISFNGTAALTLINIAKTEETIVFSCPMSTAALKGCHDVQNLGAVQTYLRRYLYINAMEIVEHDALDATTGGADKAKPEQPAKKPAQKKEEPPVSHDNISEEQKAKLKTVIKNLKNQTAVVNEMKGLFGVDSLCDLHKDTFEAALEYLTEAAQEGR